MKKIAERFGEENGWIKSEIENDFKSSKTINKIKQLNKNLKVLLAQGKKTFVKKVNNTDS